MIGSIIGPIAIIVFIGIAFYEWFLFDKKRVKRICTLENRIITLKDQLNKQRNLVKEFQCLNEHFKGLHERDTEAFKVMGQKPVMDYRIIPYDNAAEGYSIVAVYQYGMAIYMFRIKDFNTWDDEYDRNCAEELLGYIKKVN